MYAQGCMMDVDADGCTGRFILTQFRLIHVTDVPVRLGLVQNVKSMLKHK